MGYVLMALLMLAALIILHEAGHFWAARICGIAVQEFSIGMGPLLLKHMTKKGTQVSLRLLPIGGYCQFFVEDEASEDPRAFEHQALWKRLVTVFSGPLMNFIAAFVIIIVYLSFIGLETPVPVVGAVEEIAAATGLSVGDRIVSVNGETMDETQMIAQTIAASRGENVSLNVDRNGEELTLNFSPFFDESLGRWRVGFSFAQRRQRVSFLTSIPFSLQYNIENATLIVRTLKDLLVSGQGVNDVTGPVGTVAVISDVTRQGGLDVYLELIAVISVNLGIMNLLPIPGLDGSRLLFLLFEAIRRKPVRRELEGAIHMTGFIILMGLMLLLTYKDILQFIVNR